jgi:crotonobetainyl-CoA:carnitine CoA-transferase CaiB-like acyl-CoA transferase
MGTKDPVIAPYQTYPTKDGYLNIGGANQKLWEALCEALERPDLAEDPRFATNADRVDHLDELEAELSDIFQNRPTDEWVELLADEHGIPAGPVLSVHDALYNEQTAARGVLTEFHHPAVGSIPVVEHPLNFEQATAGFERPPPLLGEDTVAMLQELGYTDDEIVGLKQSGAIPDRTDG